jgi:peroxiredoxin
MIDDAAAALAKSWRQVRLVPGSATIVRAKNRRAEVARTRCGEHRLAVARVGDAVMHDVAEKLRPRKAPRAARGIGVQLPEPLARRNKQRQPACAGSFRLRHETPLDEPRLRTAEVTPSRRSRQDLPSAGARGTVAIFRYNHRPIATRHAGARSSRGATMTIKVGDQLPAGSLSEYVEVESAECKIGPNEFKIDDLTRGKKVVLFGLPGAFTPTCSAKHVPGYVANYDKLKAKGVSEVLCMSVNDAFVMGAWAKEQKAGGKVRMMGDGSAGYTKALGLELDLTARGMGVRCQRFSALIDNGVVKTLNIEGPGKFEVSDADTMLKQLG